MNKTEAQAKIKFLRKKDMTPEGTLALKCYRNPLIDHIQPCLTFICSLNSNHTFLFTSLKKFHGLEECLGDQGASIFRERIAMHEHCRTKCIHVMGGYIKKWCKAVWIVSPILGGAKNFLNYPCIVHRILKDFGPIQFYKELCISMEVQDYTT